MTLSQPIIGRLASAKPPTALPRFTTPPARAHTGRPAPHQVLPDPHRARRTAPPPHVPQTSGSPPSSRDTRPPLSASRTLVAQTSPRRPGPHTPPTADSAHRLRRGEPTSPPRHIAHRHERHGDTSPHHAHRAPHQGPEGVSPRVSLHVCAEGTSHRLADASNIREARLRRGHRAVAVHALSRSHGVSRRGTLDGIRCGLPVRSLLSLTSSRSREARSAQQHR